MGAEDGETLLRHTLRSLVANDGFLLQNRTLSRIVAINEVVTAPGDGLQILVDVVGAGRRVHPAGAVVEALIDEKLSPRHCAIGIQALLTRHLHFGAKEKRSVRIDEKQ